MEAAQAFLYSLPIRPAEGTTWAAELIGDIPAEHGALVGAHDVGSAIILFAEQGAYVIQGSGPDVTGAGNSYTDPQFLPGSVGLADHRAKVTAPDGLMFWARGKPHLITGGLQTVEPGPGGAGYPELTITGALVATGRPAGEPGASAEAVEEVRFYSSEGTALVYSYAWRGWGTHTSQPARNLVVDGQLALRADGTRLVREAPDTTYDEVAADGTGGQAVILAWSHAWIHLADFTGVQRLWWLHLAAHFGETAQVVAKLYRDLRATQDTSHTWTVPAANAVDTLRWHLGPTYQRCQAFRVRWEVTPTTLPAVAVNRPFRLHGLGVEFGTATGKDHRAGRR